MVVVLLSLDAAEVCGVCHVKPPDYDVLRCDSCSCDWHMKCLQPPLTAVPEGHWACPDCSGDPCTVPTGVSSAQHGLVKQIREIENDKKLTPEQKAKKRQILMSNGVVPDFMDEVDDLQQLMCLFCRNRLERPVTTPCGHNFCLPCLQKAFGKCGKRCSKCRAPLSEKFMEQPRINLVLVSALRMAKVAANGFSTPSSSKPVHVIREQDRPDKAFTTERAVRKGRANAASGKMMVETPPFHFGPITAEHDYTRGQGVLVGETWADRMDCRQWGTHLTHVAGICGRGRVGAQSVALSGGYIDDEDHGEWFLYTGSGGRDLSGNKRTNSKQSFDQLFTKGNLALVTSCLKGYPVRVVRSHKEKRSSYAPVEGVRYDGIYRIEKCWRKLGAQKFLVCRYLFVRCDNEPAPWTSDTVGDRPRSLPDIAHELKGAIDIKVRKETPAWDWKEHEGVWGWTRPPPVTAKSVTRGKRNKLKSFERELKTKFRCGICKEVLQLPLSTPCGHSYCRECLVGQFGRSENRDRGGDRRLRVQKVIKRCPGCKADITDFMSNPAVNNEMDQIIQSLKKAMETSAAEIQRELEEHKEESQEDINEEEDEDEDTDREGENEEDGDETKQADSAMQTELADNSSRKASIVAEIVHANSKVVNAAEECPAACSKICEEDKQDSKEVSSPKRKQLKRRRNQAASDILKDASGIAESPPMSGSGRRTKRKRGEQVYPPGDSNLAGVEVVTAAKKDRSIEEDIQAQIDSGRAKEVKSDEGDGNQEVVTEGKKNRDIQAQVEAEGTSEGKADEGQGLATGVEATPEVVTRAKKDRSIEDVEAQVVGETVKAKGKKKGLSIAGRTQGKNEDREVKETQTAEEEVAADKKEPASRARKKARESAVRKAAAGGAQGNSKVDDLTHTDEPQTTAVEEEVVSKTVKVDKKEPAARARKKAREIVVVETQTTAVEEEVVSKTVKADKNEPATRARKKARESVVVEEQTTAVEEEVISKIAKADKKEPATRARKKARESVVVETQTTAMDEEVATKTAKADKKEPATRARKKAREIVLIETQTTAVEEKVVSETVKAPATRARKEARVNKEATTSRSRNTDDSKVQAEMDEAGETSKGKKKEAATRGRKKGKGNVAIKEGTATGESVKVDKGARTRASKKDVEVRRPYPLRNRFAAKPSTTKRGEPDVIVLDDD